MKRGRKPSNDRGDTAREGTRPLVKSTYLLEPVLKQNLAYLALAEGIDQSDVVREALADYLKKKKLDPDSPPKFYHRD